MPSKEAKLTTTHHGQLGILLATIAMSSVTGCAAWTPPPNFTPQAPAATTMPVKPSQRQQPVVRGQQPTDDYYPATGPEGYSREPLAVSGTTPNRLPPPTNSQTAGPPARGNPRYENRNDSGYDDPYDDRAVQPAQFVPNYGASGVPQTEYLPAPQAAPGTVGPGPVYPGNLPAGPNGGPVFTPGPNDLVGQQPYTGRFADLIVNVREQQTGRFMFGVGVNSDAGLTGQIVVDEYNFNWKRFPRGVDDILNGTAWRGGGQRLRIEAIPGSELQRYLVNFTEPYLLDTNISLNLSAFLYDRRYFDWDEQRVGGRIGLGYRLTPDLSLSAGMRLENVNIRNPRVLGVTELDNALGDSSLFSGRVTLTHDTRDSPFAPTEGHMLELSYEQVFGTFDYPRGIVDYRRYFLLNERPDGSGRHVLGASVRTGFSGAQTPIYENFFAGGYSTLRGFRFRSASPQSDGVYVGGEFSLLGSVEYIFPITADDMLKGVVFSDFGTIEEKIEINKDDFRVAVGAGLRVSVPAMGPAPIALDLAVPISREQTDRIQNFSFFVGFGR